MSLVLLFEVKLKNESITFVIPISFCKEVEITSEKGVNHSEESNDEEKFRMVVKKRMTNAIRVESSSCQKEANALKNSGHSHNLVKNGKTFPNVFSDLGSMVKDKKSTWQ